MPAKLHSCVVIESPYAGDIDMNMEYLADAIRDCVLRGEAPYASHLMMTKALDDDVPAERETGIACGHMWAAIADKVVVYEDLGISPGMRASIVAHKSAGRKIEMRSLKEWKGGQK